jgi:hypothetical protein
MAYVAGDSARPAELFTSSIDGRSEKKLTSFNDALVKEVEAVAADRILLQEQGRHRNRGLGVEAARLYASRAWPLILTMHGGPHSAYGHSFSFEHQLFAANGYLVVYTNPRGSTNYGEKFLWATWGGWGNLDFEDVMAGVDYAKTKYNVDEKRMGVTGIPTAGSSPTGSSVTPTGSRRRFPAPGSRTGSAITRRSDIPRTKESEFFGAPWDRGRDILEKQSPITYASQFQDANAVRQRRVGRARADRRGRADVPGNCASSASPARMVRYPDTYHGGWSPWNTVHRYYEEMKWWERYLGASKATPTTAQR